MHCFPLISLLTPDLEIFFPMPTKQTPAGCSTVQVNSDTNHNQSRPHRLKSLPHKTAPHFRCQSQVVGSQVTHNFSQTWLQIGYKMGLSSGLITCQNSSQNSCTQLIYHCQFITRDILKDASKLPDEEIHRARSGQVLSARASVPVELGYTTFLAHRCVHQPRHSLNSIVQGFYGGLLHSLYSFSSPSPLSGGWEVRPEVPSS